MSDKTPSNPKPLETDESNCRVNTRAEGDQVSDENEIKRYEWVDPLDGLPYVAMHHGHFSVPHDRELLRLANRERVLTERVEGLESDPLRADILNADAAKSALILLLKERAETAERELAEAREAIGWYHGVDNEEGLPEFPAAEDTHKFYWRVVAKSHFPAVRKALEGSR